MGPRGHRRPAPAHGPLAVLGLLTPVLGLLFVAALWLTLAAPFATDGDDARDGPRGAVGLRAKTERDGDRARLTVTGRTPVGRAAPGREAAPLVVRVLGRTDVAGPCPVPAVRASGALVPPAGSVRVGWTRVTGRAPGTALRPGAAFRLVGTVAARGSGALRLCVHLVRTGRAARVVRTVRVIAPSRAGFTPLSVPLRAAYDGVLLPVLRVAGLLVAAGLSLWLLLRIRRRVRLARPAREERPSWRARTRREARSGRWFGRRGSTGREARPRRWPGRRGSVGSTGSHAGREPGRRTGREPGRRAGRESVRREGRGTGREPGRPAAVEPAWSLALDLPPLPDGVRVPDAPPWGGWSGTGGPSTIGDPPDALGRTAGPVVAPAPSTGAGVPAITAADQVLAPAPSPDPARDEAPLLRAAGISTPLLRATGTPGASARAAGARREARWRERRRLEAEAAGEVWDPTEVAPFHVRAWSLGADGEELAAERFASLARGYPGVHVLHDRREPGRGLANIDHVLVGPAGVVVADTKNWSGVVRIEAGRLHVRGKDRTAAIDGVLGQVSSVRAVLAAAGLGAIPVLGVLHWTRSDGVRLDGSLELQGVPLLDARGTMMRAIDGAVLGQDGVVQVQGVLEAGLRSAG